MNLDLALVLLMLAAAVAMFVVNRPRIDAVALLVLVAMPLTGIITMNEALAGFSDSSIILIAALFVIGEGLVRTGVARRLGDWLDAQAGTSENRLLILLMAAVAGLGSLMSSTAVVAIFIPVVLRITQNRGMSPGRLMMPLSFAALISGMLTLVATAPNLVVNAELIRQGAEGFNFFNFTPFGCRYSFSAFSTCCWRVGCWPRSRPTPLPPSFVPLCVTGSSATGSPSASSASSSPNVPLW
jgi:di/tricarboxylate transporter